jgi:hypothetical protein
VHVQVGDVRVVEEAPDPCVEQRALDDVRVAHPAIAVVGAHRQQAAALLFRHLVAEYRGFARRFADEDRSDRAIRRRDVQVRPRQQQQPLTGFGIAQRDPAGKALLVVGHLARDTACAQCAVVEVEQGPERLHRQSADHVTHRLFPIEDGGILPAAEWRRYPIRA